MSDAGTCPAPDDVVGPPTLAGFQSWCATTVGIPASALPSDATAWTWAYNIALSTVSCYLCCAPPFFTLAVYNLGADNLLNWAQDPQDAPIYATVDGVGYKFFAYMRMQFGINAFIAGTVSSSSDQGTSQSIETTDVFKTMLPGDLVNLKTPYGRAYLAIATRMGSLWGLS